MARVERYFIDSEFVDDGEVIMPISIAIVDLTGRSLYLEFEHDEGKARSHDFVRENVLPHLAGQEQYSPEEGAKRIAFFMGLDRPRIPGASKPIIECWAYFADYDWVLFCHLFGGMMDLPDPCPRLCMDLMQWWVQLGKPAGVKPPKPIKAHHALADADWNLDFYRRLVQYEQTSRASRPPWPLTEARREDIADVEAAARATLERCKEEKVARGWDPVSCTWPDQCPKCTCAIVSQNVHQPDCPITKAADEDFDWMDEERGWS